MAAPMSVIQATCPSTRRPTRPGCGAERHSQSELARPLRHGVRQDAVEPDGGEHRGEGGEGRSQRADHPIERGVLSDLFAHRPWFVHGQIRIEARDGGRNAAEQRRRIAGRPDVERQLAAPLVLAVRA